MRMILVRGLPGSGKTTFVKRSYPNLLHVESDMLTVVNGKYDFVAEKLKERHATCISIASLALLCGSDVVVSNTFTTLKEMAPYLDAAKKSKAEIIVIKMTGNYTSVHNVPADVLQRMQERWEDYEGELCPNNP